MLPAVDSDGTSETGFLLVSQSMLHQTQDTMSGAGHQTCVITGSWPLVVGEVCQVNLLPSLRHQIRVKMI